MLIDGLVFGFIFFNELSTKFNASGDFSQAYVIAHEVGHHIQTILGISEQVHKARQQVSDVQAFAANFNIIMIFFLETEKILSKRLA